MAAAQYWAVRLTGPPGTTRAVALGAEPFAPGFTLDGDYEPVLLPTPVAEEPGGNPFALAQPLDFSVKPEVATYLVRG